MESGFYGILNTKIKYMDTKKEAKKYLDKYFKSQYINENDDAFNSLVRLLNKAQNQPLQLHTVSSSTGWETDDFMYGIKVLLSQKPKDESLLKAIEELGELSVKLLQYLNKPESINEGDIEEEIADCEMHFHILNNYFPVSKNIRERKIEKFLQSKDYKLHKTKYEGK